MKSTIKIEGENLNQEKKMEKLDLKSKLKYTEQDDMSILLRKIINKKSTNKNTDFRNNYKNYQYDYEEDFYEPRY
ncbi:MAG: hypothetical protein RR942_18425 [Romboutsia sp.]